LRLVVGITGGIGSGKSAVTDRLAGHGVTIVDADIAARAVVEPGRAALGAIAEHFGAAVLHPDGTLNRAALRRQVFENPAQRRWLEALTHPLIGEEIGAQLRASTSAYTVLSSPLLLESSAQRSEVALVVVVDAPEAVQVQRTMRRDGNDEALIRRIMDAQLPRAERLAGADRVIDNSGGLEHLHRQVDELHADLLARAQRRRA